MLIPTSLIIHTPLPPALLLCASCRWTRVFGLPAPPHCSGVCFVASLGFLWPGWRYPTVAVRSAPLWLGARNGLVSDALVAVAWCFYPGAWLIDAMLEIDFAAMARRRFTIHLRS